MRASAKIAWELGGGWIWRAPLDELNADA